MKLQTLTKILNWFEEYQGDEPKDKMINLYEKLVEEEQKELKEAEKNKDAVEILDAIGDILWVRLGLAYFKNENIVVINVIIADALYKINDYFKTDGKTAKVLNDLMLEIANSNYTKTKQKEKGEKAGKIIKGYNYKKPDIEKIIEKYNLKLNK